MTERHLILQESVLPPSSEWTPRNHGWLMARISEGVGYWMQPGIAARELTPGDGFIVGHNSPGILRASQLSPLKLQFFVIQPQHLNGLLAVTEWHQLEVAPNNLSSHVSVFTVAEPIGQKFARIANQSPCDKLPMRCALLQLWANAMADLLPTPLPSIGMENKLRERFRRLVGRMTEAELSECSLAELAGELHCSERHFSRLFREEFGVPLRARQIELRLQRARQLLAETDAKIINVAFDSGYRHLGLFNTMFKKRFGMTPGEWRQQNAKKNSINGQRPGGLRPAVALTWLLLAGIFFLARHAAGQDETESPAMAQARQALFDKMAELDEQDRRPKFHIVPATTNGPHFKVSRYLIMGNSVLPPETLGAVLTNVPSAFGTNVSFADVRAMLGDLQMAYREHGFPTVSVGLPQQKLTNGEVKVQVTEGVVTAVNVTGNRYYRSNDVMRTLPSVRPGMLLNSHVFQRELDAANSSRDRQIYPVIGPGPDPGTTELTLKVKDRFPLHARLEVNNQHTPNTPDLRVNASVQYDNLWDREHQVGLQYSASFQRYRETSYFQKSPLDDPFIANYSGYYRMPLGGYRSVQDELDANPGRFGYNEVTHQFTLPPNVTGRPELTLYASRSVTDTGVIHSGKTNLTDQVFQDPNSGIISETLFIRDNAGQNISVNEGAGWKFTMPLPETATVDSVLSFGADFKRYRLISFNTNESIFETFVFDPRSLEPTVPIDPQPPLIIANAATPVHSALDYLPLNVGVNGSFPVTSGKTFFNATANFNPLRFLSNDRDFAAAGYSTNAHAQYVTVQLGVDQIHNLPGDWILKLHADGQWADGPLVSNEQYGMGGSGSVRGYTDGEAYGDTGWRLSVESQTPPMNLGSIGNEGHMETCWLRASTFVDYGQIYLLDPIAAARISRRSFCGFGTGLSANIGSHLDARLTVAWPLLTDPTPGTGTPAGRTHVYFGIGAQF